MQSKISKVFWVLVLTIGLIISGAQSQTPGCEGQDAPVQCVLYREYGNLNDDMGCQLCAVAIQYDSTLQKAQKYCNNEKGKLRQCGLTSFAYLLLSGKLIQAFDLQYDIFYSDPFNHDQKVSTILKKHFIRSSLITWLQLNQQNTKPNIMLQKSIANLYLFDMIQSQNQLNNYLSQNKHKLDKRTVKLKCRLLQKQGQFNQAYHILSKHILQAESNQRMYQSMLQPYLYHLNGNLLMHHLKFTQAIKQFKKASNMFKSQKQDVKFMRGWRLSNYNIGLCYQKLGKFDQAVKVYNELIMYVEKNAEILNALGNSYVEWAEKQQQQQSNTITLDEQKLRKGIFYLSRAIDMNSQYYIAYYNLGYAYLKSNSLQKAVQKFTQSLNITQTRQAQYGLLAAYLLQVNHQQVQTLLPKLAIDDESIDDLLSVYYQNTNVKQNRKFYTKVIAQYEPFIKSASGHYWKAMIEYELENYGLAIDHFLQAYDKGYAEPHLLFNLAYAYQLVGDHLSALTYYEKTYKKDPRKETKLKIQENKRILQQKSTNHHQEL